MIAAADITTDWLLTLLRDLGPTGALLVIIAYTLRRVILWLMPHAERVVDAHIARQEKMGKEQERLTNACIEIQTKNAEALRELNAKLPGVCKVKS